MRTECMHTHHYGQAFPQHRWQSSAWRTGARGTSWCATQHRGLTSLRDHSMLGLGAWFGPSAREAKTRIKDLRIQYGDIAIRAWPPSWRISRDTFPPSVDELA